MFVLMLSAVCGCMCVCLWVDVFVCVWHGAFLLILNGLCGVRGLVESGVLGVVLCECMCVGVYMCVGV